MAEPYVGEIKLFGFNFAPPGWAFCDGQVMPISQNEALFQLIGTTYGGDGQVSFGLPDLRGRTPVHPNGVFPIGTVAGVESVTLTPQQMPAHVHTVQGGLGKRDAPSPAGAFLVPGDMYGTVNPSAPPATFAPTAVQTAGGSAPHPNMQPYLAISFCIALFGIFPSQT